MEELFALGRTLRFHFVDDGLEALSGEGLGAGLQIENLGGKAREHRVRVGQGQDVGVVGSSQRGGGIKGKDRGRPLRKLVEAVDRRREQADDAFEPHTGGVVDGSGQHFRADKKRRRQSSSE